MTEKEIYESIDELAKYDGVLYFDNDDQFTDFCLSSKPIPQYNEKLDMYFYDIPYTANYNYAVEKGYQFYIKNPEKSSVYKHGGVTRRLITKPVSNLIYL